MFTRLSGAQVMNEKRNAHDRALSVLKFRFKTEI